MRTVLAKTNSATEDSMQVPRCQPQIQRQQLRQMLDMHNSQRCDTSGEEISSKIELNHGDVAAIQ